MRVAFIEKPRALLTNGWSRQQVTVERRSARYTDIDVVSFDNEAQRRAIIKPAFESSAGSSRHTYKIQKS